MKTGTKYIIGISVILVAGILGTIVRQAVMTYSPEAVPVLSWVGGALMVVGIAFLIYIGWRNSAEDGSEEIE